MAIFNSFLYVYQRVELGIHLTLAPTSEKSRRSSAKSASGTRCAAASTGLKGPQESHWRAAWNDGDGWENPRKTMDFPLLFRVSRVGVPTLTFQDQFLVELVSFTWKHGLSCHFTNPLSRGKPFKKGMEKKFANWRILVVLSFLGMFNVVFSEGNHRSPFHNHFTITFKLPKTIWSCPKMDWRN